jgi:hypothetical protein
MLRPRPAPSASLVELATGPDSSWSWSSSPSPTAVPGDSSANFHQGPALASSAVSSALLKPAYSIHYEFSHLLGSSYFSRSLRSAQYW